MHGWWPIFPNAKHGGRTDGAGCPSLSPKIMGPIDHGQPSLPPAQNLENLHQGNKVFPSEAVDSHGEATHVKDVHNSIVHKPFVPSPTFFETQREMYEKRAEITTKKLLSKIYALEAKALEARQNTQEKAKKASEQGNWEETLNKLSEERENLNKKYQELIQSSQKNWNDLYEKFESYAGQVSNLREDFTERSSGWIDSLNDQISHLQDLARESGQTLGSSFDRQMSQLKGQLDGVEQQLTDMQSKSDQQWQGLKNDIDQELKTIRSTLSNLYGHFRKQGQQDNRSSAEKQE